MKKVLFLTLVFSALISTATYAQTSGTQSTSTKPSGNQAAPDLAAMLEKAKETQVPLMVEKTGLTKEQATRIVEINFETRVAAMGLRDLSEADRTAKLAELKAEKEKKYSEVLSPEQIKAVKSFYEEMAKNKEPKPNH